MPIKTDWNISLNEVDPTILLSGSITRMLSKPGVREDWEIALAESQALIQPAAVWAFAQVGKFLHERVVMENGAVLTGGPIAEVMAGAEQLIVGVCTAGAAISRASSAAKQNGSLMRSMFYDLFGTYAVGMVRQQMVDMFEKEIRSQGLHISTMLAPGESTWPVSQQAALFSLVDAAQIGVTLTETMMMNPFKSASMVMGFGPNPLGSEGATNCDFCTIRDTCPSSQAGTRKVEPLAG
jgi:hypothetical protein